MAEGATIDEAAKSAGMASKTSIAFLARADVAKALHGQRVARLYGAAVPRALKAALDVLEDPDAAPSIRSKTAMGVLDMARKMELVEYDRDVGSPAVDNLSPDDLARLAARVREELASADAIEASYTEITPSLPESDLF